jgi:hypothetical protein
MATIFPFKLGIDHNAKRLHMTVIGDNNQKITAKLTSAGLAEFVAILSQCQYALALSRTGQEVDLPIDPNIAFEPVAGGYALGTYDIHERHLIGIDTQAGAVVLTLLSHRGRLTGIRMSPNTARTLGAQLQHTADRVSSPQRPH